MVTMRRREDDAGRAGALQEAVGRLQAPDPLTGPITPPMGLVVPPAPVPEVQDHASVRPAAGLASALGTAEADRGRQFAPVDRVEPAVVPADRHGGAGPRAATGSQEPTAGNNGRQ